jgi:hypothetical protein
VTVTGRKGVCWGYLQFRAEEILLHGFSVPSFSCKGYVPFFFCCVKLRERKNENGKTKERIMERIRSKGGRRENTEQKNRVENMK